MKRKAAALLILVDLWEEEEGRQRKRGTIRNWIRRRGRGELGYFTTIGEELPIEDTPTYKEMMRMKHSQVIEALILKEI